MNRRFSHAAFTAALIRFARLPFNSGRLRRFGAIVAIAVFLLQIFILPSKAVVFAKGRNVTSAPVSAPPEPFVVGGGGSVVPSIVGFVSSSVVSLGNVFAVPKVPEGLTVPPPPSFVERAINGLGSVLAFITPSAKSANSSAPQPLPSPTPAGPVHFDFDGDSKADVGRWHGANTEFKIKNSGGGSDTLTTIGASSSRSAPFDYDGDGKTDVVVFNAGTWNIKKSTDGSTTSITSFGQAGDIPMPGDWVGSSAGDAAYYRPSTGYWYFRDSNGGSQTSAAFGTTGDIPVAGNYDGDTKMDVAVYRPSTGDWHISGSTSGYSAFHWGIASDIPVPADYDNDGKTDPAVYRGTTGDWYAAKSSTGYSTYFQQTWGNYGDQPAPADYDGDGKADYCIWRPTTGEWWTLKSSGGNTSQTLGVPGDTAIPSSYIRQIGGTVTGYEMATARLSPKNATGGTDLYSQNFGWGTSLVGLPGRAGMNAELGLSYNSLNWIKSGSEMYFDPDTSNVAPGFRMGFPTIEPIYYDTDKSKWAYIMVTSSGGRVEFRQTAVSGTYETADSSYTQLVVSGASNPNDPVEDISMTVKTTDGTQMTYEWKSAAYRCTRITDRNGNYMSNTYNSIGQLATITDTLGRVITVNYSSGSPSTISQTWRDSNGSGSTMTHTYATLTYSTKTVDTDWHDGITGIYGPPEDTAVKVLDKITYPDGSFTKFEYNGYLQVKKVINIAADSTSHVLNSVETNLVTPVADAEDCPKLTQTSTTVENFNGGSPVVVNNTLTTGQSYSLPNSISGSATRIQVWLTGHPDDLRSNTFVGASGWKEGLPLATEDCITTSATCTTRKRWTWTDYTQDNTSVSYFTNPRVIESRVGDGTNTKKTTVDYYEPTTGVFPYGLPVTVEVYDTNLSTVLKTQTTAYNLSGTYTDRRIIGLPSETKLYQGTTSDPLMSKVTFAYDYDDDFAVSGMGQNITGATQHDDTNYGSTFSAGRGNLTSTTRWDVNNPTSSGHSITNTILYNTLGSPVAGISPWDGTNTRTTKISYTDNFNSSPGVSTHAYPTTLTDPANNSSTIKYRYDIGANVEATSPAPAGQTYGKTSKREYDDTTAMLKKDSVFVNTALKYYTRFAVPSPDNGIQRMQYSTIIDTVGSTSGPDTADEVLSEVWLDGAGRSRRTRTEHPGSTGGWTASQTEYDILGRVYRTGVPTEVSVNGTTWTVAGDDYSRGWVWNYSFYDWKGRIERTIPSDSNGTDDKDTLITYEGCGCAGGLITTVKGPVTTAIDVAGNTQTTKRRTQKVYEDILGRPYKSETWDLDGQGSTPYRTTKTTFNGRDQATLIRQYAGNDSSGTYQDTTMSYDGHGRLSESHKPEQAVGRPIVHTYYPDDSLATKTDSRGAIANYQYESRGLIDEVSYSLPSDNEGETPWIWETEKTGSTSMVIRGGGFSSNVDITIMDGSNNVLETISDGSITTGSGGGYQTLSFSVSNSTVIANLGTLNWMSIRVKNTNSSQASRYAPFNFNFSSTSYAGQSSDAVIAAPTVSYSYDAMGNRTAMTDGAGSLAYSYDSLSRLTSETRTFTEITSRTFANSYTYEIGGQLKTITDPYSAVVTYSRQKNGRLSQVGGTGYDWTNPFISNMQYRAWGTIKSASYGNGSALAVTFDIGHRPTQYATTYSAETRGTNYTYNNDGSLSFAEDLKSDVFDKAYKYDFAGRLSIALSGFEARGESNPDSYPLVNRPFKQTYTYDVWDNRVGGENKFWRTDLGATSAMYVSNRNQAFNAPAYDANGQARDNKLDAAHRPVEHVSGVVGGYGSFPREPAIEITQTFSGDSSSVKREVTERRDEDPGGTPHVSEETKVTFELQSAALGNVVTTEIKPDGTRKQQNIYADGLRIAEYELSTHILEINPLTSSRYRTDSYGYGIRDERDPKGANTGTEDPWLLYAEPQYLNLAPLEPFLEMGGNPFDTQGGCEKDGMAYNCNQLDHELDSGSSVAMLSFMGVNVAQFSGYRLRQMMGSTVQITVGIHNWMEYTHTDVIVEDESFSEVPQNDSHTWSFTEISLSRVVEGRNPAVPSSAARKPSYRQIVDTFVACVKKYWGDLVIINGASEAAAGTNGKIDVSYLSAANLMARDTIVTDTSFTGQGLANLQASWYAGKVTTAKDPINGVAFPMGNKTISGDLYLFTPLLNYAASDSKNHKYPDLAKAIGGFNYAQFHEGGNSIAYLTGVDIGNPNDLRGDKDSGQRITNCMANALSNGN